MFRVFARSTSNNVTVPSWAIELLPGYCQHTNNVTVPG